MIGLTVRRTGSALLLVLALSACSFGHGVNLPRAEQALENSKRLPPQPASFAVCRDHGCSTERRVGLTTSEWAAVTAPLHEPAADAAEERQRVAEAVGRFELVAGAKAGTHGDVGGTLTGFLGGQGQQDCVDEAVTTTRFLLMLRNDGLLHHHEVSTPVHRAWVMGEFTHLTATLVALTGDGRRYAVDSWFHGNGHAAEVVDLDAWLDGWEPPVWNFEAKTPGTGGVTLAGQ